MTRLRCGGLGGAGAGAVGCDGRNDDDDGFDKNNLSLAIETLRAAGVAVERLCRRRRHDVDDAAAAAAGSSRSSTIVAGMPLCDDDYTNDSFFFQDALAGATTEGPNDYYYPDRILQQDIGKAGGVGGAGGGFGGGVVVATAGSVAGGTGRVFHWHNVIGAVVTVFCVAFCAGLFLGMMTLDELDLRIIIRSSIDEDEVRYAKTLLPIIRDKHKLLVTILLMDTLTYEALPIFLDTLMSGWVAVLLSTSLILVFGEIFPSGICTGPNQLYLAYRMSPVMKFFLMILHPVAKPLGKLLDWLVNEDEDDMFYDRLELSALVRIQHEERTKKLTSSRSNNRPGMTKMIKYVRNKDRQWNDLKSEIMEKVNERAAANAAAAAASGDYYMSNNYKNNVFPGNHHHYPQDDNEAAAVDQLTPPLHQREVDMVEGSLSMKTKLAMDVYTPLRNVYSVPDDLVLDKSTITTIYGHGYSRVPVYRRRASNPGENDKDKDTDKDCTLFVGYLITRQLMLIDWTHERTLDTLPLQRPTCASPRLNLVDLLRLFQTKGLLLTFVCARPDLANRSLAQDKPIPVEAGLIGIITLVDIVESILQDRIYDESDIRDRSQAVATLHRWAATKLQNFFVRRRRTLIRTGSWRRSISPPHTKRNHNMTQTQQQQQQQGTGSGAGAASAAVGEWDGTSSRIDSIVSTEVTPLLSTATTSSLQGSGRLPVAGSMV